MCVTRKIILCLDVDNRYKIKANRIQKWKQDENNIKIDDIVWVLDKENEVGRWPLGRVIEMSTGRDERIRVVKLLCEGKTITRPIRRIFPLEGLTKDDENTPSAARRIDWKSRRGECCDQSMHCRQMNVTHILK